MAQNRSDAGKEKQPFSFQIFGGTWTFRLIPSLITLALVPVMIGLGCWQIQRLHWKEDLIATMHARMQERAIDVGLSSIAPDNIPNMDFHPGKASGLFQNDHPLYLAATSVGNGEGGYDILVPLTLDNGSVLLVNRGWMPYALKDKPDSGSGQYELYRPVGPVHLTGVLRLPPDKKPGFRPENDPGKNAWYWIDLPAMAQAAGVKEFLPYVLEADDAPHDGNYPIGGQTRIDLPNHHFQYALTWFWLAAILPIIYLVSGWRKNMPEKPAEVATEGEKAKPE